MVGGVIAPPLEVEQQKRESKQQKVIFILEGANLEIGKVGKNYQLLNPDDHSNFLRKHKKDIQKYRPDIIQQALLQILDSPLNKAGKISGIYIHTEKNAVIEVNPKVRIPRTFKRFQALMVQLLQKLSIRASNGPDKLLKIIKSPVTLHLPSDSHRMLLSYSAKDLISPAKLIDSVPQDKTLVFIIGAFAHGKVDASYQDQEVKISDFPLSAAYCVTRLTNALENKWDII